MVKPLIPDSTDAATDSQVRSNNTGGVMAAAGKESSSNKDLKIGEKDCTAAEIVEDWRKSSVAATIMDGWSTLARKLGLTSAQIKVIRKKIHASEHEEFFEAIIEMLELWQREKSDEATAEALIKALEDIQWKELADLVKVRKKKALEKNRK